MINYEAGEILGAISRIHMFRLEIISNDCVTSHLPFFKTKPHEVSNSTKSTGIFFSHAICDRTVWWSWTITISRFKQSLGSALQSCHIPGCNTDPKTAKHGPIFVDQMV